MIASSKRKWKVHLMKKMVVAICGLLLIFILHPCQALNTAAGESTNTTMRQLQQDTRCECQDKSLQCPDTMLSNFEDTSDIREEGDRALWALECSGKFVFWHFEKVEGAVTKPCNLLSTMYLNQTHTHTH